MSHQIFSSQHLKVSYDQAQSKVTLELVNHKERHPIALALVLDLQAALKEIEALGNCHLLVAQATHPKTVCGENSSQEISTTKKIWCAGGMLREHASFSPAEAKHFSHTMSLVKKKLQSLPLLTLACIDGYAIGGGVELACFFDMRIATLDAKFVFKQLAIGLPCAFSSAQDLARIVGLGRAAHAMYTTATVSAEQAENWGLVTSTFKNWSKLESFTSLLATQCAEIPTKTILAQKQMFYDNDKSLDHSELFSNVWDNPRHKQVVNDFIKNSSAKQR